MVGGRLHRLRMRFGHPIALKGLSKTLAHQLEGAGLLRELVYMIQAVAHAV